MSPTDSPSSTLPQATSAENSTLFSRRPEGERRHRLPVRRAPALRGDRRRLHPPGPQRDWTETLRFSFAVPERRAGRVALRAGASERGRGERRRVRVRPGRMAAVGAALLRLPHAPAVAGSPRPPVGHVLRTGCRCGWWNRAWCTTSGTASATSTTSSPTSGSRGSRRRCPTSRARRRSPARRTSTSTVAVTGELQLLGEHASRSTASRCATDRGADARSCSVGARRFSYCFGASSPDEAFLAFCRPDTHLDEAEQLLSGYLIRDGALRRLATASRVNERDPETGGVARVLLDGAATPTVASCMRWPTR